MGGYIPSIVPLYPGRSCGCACFCPLYALPTHTCMYASSLSENTFHSQADKLLNHIEETCACLDEGDDFDISNSVRMYLLSLIHGMSYLSCMHMFLDGSAEDGVRKKGYLCLEQADP